jgi:hypothetical protein
MQMIGSLVAAAFIHKYGVRNILILGAILLFVGVIAQILPAEYNEY